VKALLALFALVCTLLACATVPPTTRAPDVTKVAAWKEFELTLHADVDFTDTGRGRIQEAAKKWRAASSGRVRIDVVFDLDFSSVANLQGHQESGDSLLLGVLSEYPIAKRIDAVIGSPGRMPLAATMSSDGGPTIVVLILDRIESDDFLSVVTHELGHVAGLPDLPTFGSVMSGARRRGDTSVENFTTDDQELCRSAKLCP
jgi:hypothetical protein